MSKKQKQNSTKFWIVLFGLLVVIGLVAGGTYILNDQGLISAGGGEMLQPPPQDFSENMDSTEMPQRPDGDHDSGGFNSQALLGVARQIGQIALVVLIVVGSQRLYTWLVNRRPRAVTN